MSRFAEEIENINAEVFKNLYRYSRSSCRRFIRVQISTAFLSFLTAFLAKKKFKLTGRFKECSAYLVHFNVPTERLRDSNKKSMIAPGTFSIKLARENVKDHLKEHLEQTKAFLFNTFY